MQNETVALNITGFLNVKVRGRQNLMCELIWAFCFAARAQTCIAAFTKKWLAEAFLHQHAVGSWTLFKRRQKPACVELDDVLPRFCFVCLCLFATFGFHSNRSGLIIISAHAPSAAHLLASAILLSVNCHDIEFLPSLLFVRLARVCFAGINRCVKRLVDDSEFV